VTEIQTVVIIEQVKKRFGRLEVLREVSATFEAGKSTAIVGPNASGKTTLMKCLLGLVLPDSGTVTIDGQDVNVAKTRNQIGYMPQKAQFPDNLRVQELLSWIEDLRGQRSSAREKLVNYFELKPHLQKSLRTLSGGTRQKVSAVLALMFNPSVLLFDEPTAGLDPLASSRLKDVILEQKSQGKTILLTSHVMSELEELADEVLFLLDGTIVFRGTLDDIRQRSGEMKLERAIAKLMQVPA
jgi:Cu-processing system ATP-binding protein